MSGKMLLLLIHFLNYTVIPEPYCKIVPDISWSISSSFSAISLFSNNSMSIISSWAISSNEVVFCDFKSSKFNSLTSSPDSSLSSSHPKQQRRNESKQPQSFLSFKNLLNLFPKLFIELFIRAWPWIWNYLLHSLCNIGFKPVSREKNHPLWNIIR